LSSKKVMRYTLLILVAIVILLGVTSFYRVKQGENALVLTFGKVTDTKVDAGLYWHIPLIQSTQVQSTTESYTFEYGFRTSQSGTT
jgi:regulator of protease activity HflC (stomatin/prohibitin superfamily)